MDELDRFRDFRSDVPAPSQDAQRQASARLARAIAREREPGRSILRLIGKRRNSALALAAVAAATGASLFISTPWHNSPGFLEKAQAALTAPAGTILHMKWESRAMDPACKGTSFPHETWIDQSPPHTFRAITTFPGGSDECRVEAPTPYEMGGDLDSGLELWFVPPDTLAVWPLGPDSRPPDPVRDLREAISAGRAHHEGTTQFDGRTVERIRIDPPSACPNSHPYCREPGYAYVDPKTFYLVGRENPQEMARAGGAVVPYHVIDRFLTFEYLPRTAANVALTDIQAQHPNSIP